MHRINTKGDPFDMRVVSDKPRRGSNRDKNQSRDDSDAAAMRTLSASRGQTLPRKFSELFEGNLIRSDLYTPHTLRVIERKHQRTMSAPIPTPTAYEISEGVRQAMKLPLIHAQIAHRCPWAVVWVNKHGHRKRVKFSFISEAIMFHSKIAQRFPTATIVSLCRGYDIPARLRGRLPKPWKWCPFCMKPRRYTPVYVGDQKVTFFARINFVERKLLLMECPMCGNNNRNHVFRRSNQEWTIKRIKRGRSRGRR